MNLIFKIIEHLEDTDQIIVKFCRQNSPKSIDEYFPVAIDCCNIDLNDSTAMILSLIGNFKLTEQTTNFKQIQIKMNKLCHQIEDKLTIDLEFLQQLLQPEKHRGRHR